MDADTQKIPDLSPWGLPESIATASEEIPNSVIAAQIDLMKKRFIYEFSKHYTLMINDLLETDGADKASIMEACMMETVEKPSRAYTVLAGGLSGSIAIMSTASYEAACKGENAADNEHMKITPEVGNHINFVMGTVTLLAHTITLGRLLPLIAMHRRALNDIAKQNPDGKTVEARCLIRFARTMERKLEAAHPAFKATKPNLDYDPIQIGRKIYDECLAEMTTILKEEEEYE
jgi:hypothetical protein